MSRVVDRPEAAVELLKGANRVLLTGHLNPDGDSLGSQLALAELVEAFGAKAFVVDADPVPTSLSELPGIERVTVSPELPVDFPDCFDLVAVLECSALERCGLEGIDRVPILNIDHHKANDRYGALSYLDEHAPAVGEMVWRMYDCAGVAPSAAAATNMYVALSTDTGDFKYSNATSRAFRAAEALVSAGARPEQVSEWIHERRSPGSVFLLGEALRTLVLDHYDRVATLYVDRDAFDRSGASPQDTEDIVNLPRSINGVEVVAFLKEWERGTVRISLRSKGALDVAALAARFGGGGHANAAGCTMTCDLETARQTMTMELIKMVESRR